MRSKKELESMLKTPLDYLDQVLELFRIERLTEENFRTGESTKEQKKLDKQRMWGGVKDEK